MELKEQESVSGCQCVFQSFHIHDVPAVLYGENADSVCLYIHGKGGNKEEAASAAAILCPHGFQVLGIDLPRHGARRECAKAFVPWEMIPEMQDVLTYAKQRWQRVSLYAVSIGAYVSLLAFSDEQFEHCLFLSPVLDMVALIDKMMRWAAVSTEQLQAEKEIPTDFGETLSWDYYTYAKQHPIRTWNSPTAILYAGQDHLTDRATVTEFAARFDCLLPIYEDGEHWFHTAEQLAVSRAWMRKQMVGNDRKNLRITCATRADIPEWLTVVNTVAADFPGLDMADYAKTLQKNIDRRTALCAKVDGKMAGILLFSPNHRTLSCMAVHPLYRRRGIASALIADMLRRMPDGDVNVTTFRENDPKGVAPRAPYQKCGFVPDACLTEFGYPVQRFVLHRRQ